MEAEQYQLLFDSENDHWWFAGQRRIMDAWLAPALAGLRASEKDRPLEILDAGCGTGGQLAHAAAWGNARGVDFSALALDFSRRRAPGRLARASVTALPWLSATFDLVTSLEVIYHRAVPDDGLAVCEFARVLRPGGWLFLRVPAYEWMNSEHDVQVHTRRRYTRAQVGALARAAGLEVRRLSYSNTLLFPLALAARLAPKLAGRRSSASEVAVPPAWLNTVLKGVLSAEAHLLARVNAPFGLSVLCLANKQARG